MDSPASAARSLWIEAGLPPAALERLQLSGTAPVVPSSFAIGTAMQAGLGVAALAAAELGAAHGGPVQGVTVDAADAVRESSGRFTLDGRKPELWDPLSGLYRCQGDGQGQGDSDADVAWVRVHANFAHHRDGVLQLLGLPTGAATPRAAVEKALRTWSAFAFEAAASERGLVVAAVRSVDQWQRHAQAAALETLPLVSIERIGDAPPTGWSPVDPAAAPLGGLRVLDLTRILAGPVAGRTLAAYGADVLLVNGPHLPNIEAIADTSRGKLSALLDLRDAADAERLRQLVREADVFLQGYRPGAIAGRGFAPQELARLRPGIVCVSLSAYGHAGPWAGRRGFDSLVQSATGLNLAEAEAFGESAPRALPLQALDFGAGYLLAFGALAALHRQRREGGSWLVRVALAGVGRWLASLGRLADGPRATWPSFEGAMEESASGFGRLVAVRHAARLSATPAKWVRPSMPPGSHPPAWPPRSC
ncbi:MAG: CoA transferase [Burkholderiales bacterium]|nr:CoA transferase [Burkholderiales bacterium]